MRQMIPIGEYGYDGGATARPDLKRMFGQQQPIQATFPGATPYADMPQYMPPPIKNDSQTSPVRNDQIPHAAPIMPTIPSDAGQLHGTGAAAGMDSGSSLGSSVQGLIGGAQDGAAADGGGEILSALVGA